MMRTLRGIRSDLGKSQEQMAHDLNIGLATYQRYERYENSIPTEVIVAIADMAHIVDIREIKYN